ncbi:hypothetical protein [Mangrovimonas sp. YM274]|uniref:hypothetical protein n=1 Tax=Mangrovimonas sp. YM274 TaxID=3070660 RepID=UPI0027DE7B80|nr:hypothetical protein [Mangrovimonas sp. YM274]WMI68179.1 hypothetical protein RBH95_13620 [Mangrovimonas sp. YM274]
MTKILTILIVLFLCSPCIAQINDSIVAEIKKSYSEIRNNINSYDSKLINESEETIESGQVTGYYKNGELKYIQVIGLGETGKIQTEYYFKNEKLIFVFDQNFSYNRPIYWDKKTAEENGDDEVFDSKKTTVIKDWYYFNDEKLFLWIDNEKNKVDLTLGTNTIVGRGLIAHCYKLINDLKNKN